MSKIGRKPIALGAVQIEIKGNQIHYKGKKASGVYELPKSLNVVVEGAMLKLVAAQNETRINEVWGLHRALLANKLRGSEEGFERQLRIVGLGFKATITGKKMQLSLGYSHKIDYELPSEVTVEIDKSGQLLTFRSSDKNLLGDVCDQVRSYRPPEPYKGTGIQYANEVLIRKAGKAKSA
jgi:large subunit ribosomal protein L6